MPLQYWIGVPFWGVGIAYEAAEALVDHCKNYYDLSELEVSHLAENDRSKSVIRKLGVSYVENKVQCVQGQDREVLVYISKF